MSDAIPPALTGEAHRLRSIDVLRGIAVLAVVAIHIPHWAPGGWREHPFFWLGFLADYGYLGVPLFIVISGFCIHRAAARRHALHGRFEFSWIGFWKRRFIRLYPPYVMAIAFSLFVAFLLYAPSDDPSRFFGWDLATHLLLVHNLTAEYATSLGNGAFWSLGTEEQLYALYFVLIFVMARRGDGVALGVALVVTLVWRCLVLVMPATGPSLGAFHLGQWFQWPLFYWYHWALGAYAVSAHATGRVLPVWCRSLPVAFALIGVGMVCNRVMFDLLLETRLAAPAVRGLVGLPLEPMHTLGELVIATGCFCLLNALLRLETSPILRNAGASALSGVGRISYSIYLVHVPVIYTLERHLPLGFEWLPWITRYLIYGGACLAAGFVFFQLVERWFLAGKLPWRAVEVTVPESRVS